MPGRKRLLVVGGAVLLTGLVVMFPARVLHAWLSPPGVELSGIEGSVWSGRASAARVGGAYLANLRWSFRPLALFTGRLSYRVEAEPPGGFVDAELTTGLGGLRLPALRAAVPLSAFAGVAPLADISGEVSLQLEDVVLRDGWPVRLHGQAGISGLLVRALAAEPLGDYRAEFASEDETITGSVEDLRGMLDVAATLTLAPDRSYSLVGRVAANATAATSVVEQLRFLGSADARGLREFRLEGSL